MDKVKKDLLNQAAGLRINYPPTNRSAQFVKRCLDLLLAGLGLILLSPILGLISLLVKLGSPGPVFFRQKRIGHRGKAFVMLKFRTMYQDADKVLAQQLAKNPALKAEWDCYQKLAQDPRVTRIGAFLRRFSLDELPNSGMCLSVK